MMTFCYHLSIQSMLFMVYDMKIERLCNSVYLYFIVKYINDMMLGNITLEHCGEHSAAILLHSHVLFVTRYKIYEVAHITEDCIWIPLYKVSNTFLYLSENFVTSNICATNTTQSYFHNLYAILQQAV